MCHQPAPATHYGPKVEAGLVVDVSAKSIFFLEVQPETAQTSYKRRLLADVIRVQVVRAV